MKSLLIPEPKVPFVCPRCKGALVTEPSCYRCHSCENSYPVLFGIPDFRVRSDRYLSLEEERDKARRLFEFGEHASFGELVKYYYSITFDLPENMARRYQASILAGAERAKSILQELTLGPLVDIGCGTGGLLLAAQGRFSCIYGVDIALRWLVIAQKRLRENNATAMLVCADAEAMPFPRQSFVNAVAVDLLEHVYDVDNTIREVAEILKPNGVLWLSAVNRYCVGPHPLTGVWAIGYLRASARSWVLKRLKGIDLLRFSNMVSPGVVCRKLRHHGFVALQASPKRVEGIDARAYSRLERGLIALYRSGLRVPLIRQILLWIGPAFEIVCRKSENPRGCDQNAGAE
jgi:2-polyprenyl-3-methyl-5-hydroxy-6-metoxy-1,4-benzoquinol methylase